VNRETKFLRGGVILIVILTVALLVTAMIGVQATLTNRERDAARTELVLDGLQEVAGRMDGRAEEVGQTQKAADKAQAEFSAKLDLLLELHGRTLEPFDTANDTGG